MVKQKFLTILPFSEFFLWDVKRLNNLKNFKNGIFLKDILNFYKVKISKEELIQNDWRIISKINCQGKLFLRDQKQISTYKGPLNKVPPNSIIYSKINVRHGSVYYHGMNERPFAVSAEYPIFTFDENRINGQYLTLVFRSCQFKKILNTKISGSSRARVQVDEFLNIQIPIPTLEEQNRIIEPYNKSLYRAHEQLVKAQNIEKNIEKNINILLKSIFEEST